MEDGARRRSRPALVRLPVAPDVPARAVPGLAARAVLPRRATRRDRSCARHRRGLLVARQPRLRWRRGADRRCRGRGRGHSCRLLAHGGDRRAADPRSRGFACPPRLRSHRARRARGGPGNELQVPRGLSARTARRGRLPAASAARARDRSRRGRLLRDEPVLRRASRLRRARRLPRAEPRSAGLARLRARSLGPDRVPRSPLDRPGADAPRLRARSRARSLASQPHRPDPRLVRARLLHRSLHPRSPLRPLRPTARAAARRPGRPRPLARARDAAAPGRAAHVDDPRRPAPDEDRHARGRSRLGGAPPSARRTPGGRSVAAAVRAFPRAQAPAAAARGEAGRPESRLDPAPQRRSALRDRHRGGRRPRPGRAKGLSERNRLLREASPRSPSGSTT